MDGFNERNAKLSALLPDLRPEFSKQANCHPAEALEASPNRRCQLPAVADGATFAGTTRFHR